MTEKKWTDNDLVEVQVKVPVFVTLRMTREDAESMLLDELCDVIDCVLQDAKETLDDVENDHGAAGVFRLCAQTESLRGINAEWELSPHWDNLPDDECELTCTEDGLFPRRDDL